MLIVKNNQYSSWLKSAANMKLPSNESVMRITYEGLTNLQSFMDLDCDSIESLSKACIKNIDALVDDAPNGIAPENATPGANISTISITNLLFLRMLLSITQRSDERLTLIICTTLICLGILRRATMSTSFQRNKPLQKYPLAVIKTNIIK